MLTTKSVLVLLVVGCIISCEVNAYPQGAFQGGVRCAPPGKSFYNGCNTCGCSEEGYVTFCTLRACEEDIPVPQPYIEP
ncbi:hypothetical protein Trydic_g13906 [Trypoxylus dichotomus]